MSVVCGKCGSSAATKRCGRCQVVWYCDQDCQRAHWPSHKSTCLGPAQQTEMQQRMVMAAQHEAFRLAAEERQRLAVKNWTDHDTLCEGLFYASMTGDLEIVRRARGRGTNMAWMTPKEGIFSLYIASQNNHVEVVRELISQGADVNLATTYGPMMSGGGPAIGGGTALMIASQVGNREVVRVLLAAGADPNQLDNNGSNALHFASLMGATDIVSQLIAAGAKVNESRPYDDCVPLYIAAQEGHIDIVDMLVAAGADINRVSSHDGTTALMMATQEGHAEVVRALLAAGADPRIADTGGVTALQAAQHHSRCNSAVMVEMILTRMLELSSVDAAAAAAAGAGAASAAGTGAAAGADAGAGAGAK